MCSEDDGNGLTHDFILGQNYVFGYHGPPFDVRYSDFFLSYWESIIFSKFYDKVLLLGAISWVF